MLKIAFLTMPDTLLAYPSIGLSEIASSLRESKGDKVQVNIFYPCLDYARMIGVQAYKKLEASGLNQWVFYRQAYPYEEDNTEKIRQNFMGEGNWEAKETMFDIFLNTRAQIDDYLEQIIQKYDLLSYDVVGISSAFSQNQASFALARRLKEKKKTIIIIMGGANCEYPMGKVIIDHIDAVDFVISGTGIISFNKIVDCLIQNDHTSIHQINGVYSKYNNIITDEQQKGEGYWIKPSADMHDINKQFNLEYDYDCFLDYYEQFRKDTGFDCEAVLLFETSRGCWKRDGMPCTFCGLNNPELCYESMNPELAVNFIQKLIDRYAGRCGIISGVDNIVDKSYLKTVIPYLNVPDNLTLMYETSATLTREQMKVCADNGVRIMQPGIESLNTEELKLMKKGVSAFSNIKFLKNCIEVGIYPVWSYLHSVPGNMNSSNYESILEMMPLLRHLPPPAALVPITVVRYSYYEEHKEEYALELVPQKEMYDIYPFEQEAIQNLTFTYTDMNTQSSYRKIAETYVPDMRMEIVEWMSGFRNEDEMPKLYFLDDCCIFDSRFDIDMPEIYDITQLERDILLYLNNPATYEQVEEKFKDFEEDVFNSFCHLCDLQLLFCENEKYLNLVCSEFNWERRWLDTLFEYIRLGTTENF